MALAPSTTQPSNNQEATMATNRKPTVKPTDDSSGGINTQRTAKCRTLGNGSQLTYEVGNDDKGQAYVKITAAAGGGFFSEEWISLPSIIAALDAWPSERPLTSNALAPLFRGKSANNPGFLAAALVAEGVLSRVADRKRHLARCKSTDANGGFGGFGDIARAQKRVRSSGKAKTDSVKTDKTSSTAKSPQRPTAKTDKTPVVNGTKK
jgi:hypothetical protein